VPIIEVEGLTKVFASRRKAGDAGVLRRLAGSTIRTTAVDDVSFQIERGSVVGYIGPNGAGKSTTIKMLTGILVPTEGVISVCGLDPARERKQLARRIGVVFGQRTQLWWDLPLRESFELLRYIYRVGEQRHRENLDRFVQLLDLAPLLDVPVRQLSLGQRMRGDLAAALLHDPELVLLDEPTIGLDVVAKDRIRGSIRELATSGTTVLLTTHDMGDVERLSDRVLVIDHGRLIYEGDIDALRRRFGGETVLVADLEEPGPPLEIPDARVVKVEGPRQWLRFHRDDVSAAVIVARVAAQVALKDLSLEEPAIDDVVRRIYAGESDGAAHP
jgi:ABC-2 type transport system ATP-binding protein